jgi:hypothetical protein
MFSLPSGSDEIDCSHGMKFSINGYARVDIGSTCTAEPSGGSKFDSWTGDLVTNPSNRIPTFYPTGYGTLTANFVSNPPLISNDQLFTLVTGVIVGPIVGAVLGWFPPFLRSPRSNGT